MTYASAFTDRYLNCGFNTKEKTEEKLILLIAKRAKENIMNYIPCYIIQTLETAIKEKGLLIFYV